MVNGNPGMDNVSENRTFPDISGHAEASTNQEQAIAALLQGANHQEAAAS